MADITQEMIDHGRTHLKTCECYKDEIRDPKCAKDWLTLCPWWGYQLYRHTTGDFSGPPVRGPDGLPLCAPRAAWATPLVRWTPPSEDPLPPNVSPLRQRRISRFEPACPRETGWSLDNKGHWRKG
jgi:hypothetical protein